MMSILSDWLERNSLYITLLAAWVATLGSLYFSEVAGYLPCTLCWYQRILMYPLALLLAVGLLRRDPHLPVLVLPFSLLGLGFATYHYLLEKTTLFTSHSVCQAGVSCTTAWINWFGFITIPFLSLAGFLIISVTSAIALNAGAPEPNDEAPPPWRLVLGLVVGVLLAFGVLAYLNWPAAQASDPFLLATVSATDAQSRPAPTADTELLARGARLYREACAACHGLNGEGLPNLGNALAGAEWLRTASDAELLERIRTGVPVNDPTNQSGLAMPPSGGRPDLTDEDLLAIIHYLRTEF
jgi:disulfide bond formation protein DsbB/mono/diheme cytochrome c family protein